MSCIVMFRARALAPGLLLAMSCVTSRGGFGGSVETAPFPTRGDLTSLARTPPPPDLFDNTAIVDAAWDLEGPFPSTPVPAVHRDGSAWNQLLFESVDAHPGMMVATEAQACVARELGRLHLAKPGRPGQQVQRFIRGRCLAMQPSVDYGSLDAEVPDGIPEAKIVEHFRPQVLDMLEKLGRGTREVGLWYGRVGTKATVFMTAATRTVNVVAARLPTPQMPVVELDVEVLLAAEHVEGLATRGRWDTGICTQTGTLPRLHLSCPLVATDSSSWLEVAALTPGRVLGTATLELLAFPSGKPLNRWEHTALAAHAQVRQESEIGRAFLQVLNAERARAGLGALAYAPAESESLATISAHYFSSAFGLTSITDADNIALGVMAGWDVEGLVRRGTMAHGIAIGTDDVGALLEDMLSVPAARAALLGRESSKLAVGPILTAKGQVMAVLVGAYELFDDTQIEAETKAVLDVLTKARAAKRLAPPTLLAKLGTRTRDTASRLAGSDEGREPLRQLLNVAAEETHLPTRGWTVQTSSLDRITFPDELLAPGAPAVSIGVAHRRVEGEPWGRYVIVLLTTSAGETTASNPLENRAIASAR